ncbi:MULTISPECIES: exodeoxyribonuclease VII large subunit [Planktothricoides]|uniref:Exodeoxyribonuclease 7 large subunit n=2 Tax=Planktothricoides raciborskii TaxID=132608 RepID=A0AAU8JEN2_9CYAN|nr:MULTISPECIES: exodeoxyribonuclease VII large subunit [Planktothricoides]KOR37292.1 exodeoxyribonuclease VII large subunit [Planktothricoides sp. SR001]MBD2542364.1 exodeoxyribonuclease VII large subunit [Planktothricoides raciborskii FACHB-1370]MBD2582032.1 exodeoxyribonuclease VII large subunit [Planktothricoides raciborskii FACHB-1261]
MTADLPDFQLADADLADISVVSVSGLTAYIQAVLQKDPLLRQIWVMGEVSSTRHHASGIFFTLQDEGAAIRCVTWNSQRGKLVQQPVTGEQLLVLGSIRLYPQRGDYQLTIWQALPAGEGLQALRYRQLRSRLEAEGLFDPEKKRPLPVHPQTIAVVTSPQAAAWGDIQRTLSQRYPGLEVLFSPATVQGQQAPSSIVQAIQRVEADGRAEVLILARGGGATEDLVCFDDERVVRAIADCSIPVITGIGHQRDQSLADLAADVCAHTPTAAAEIAVPSFRVLEAEHRQRMTALYRSVTQQWEEARENLAFMRSRLLQLPQTSRSLQKADQTCDLLRQKLAALDPNAVLKRGYAIAKTEAGAIARSTADLSLDQGLIIQLGEGQIKVKITEILSD